MGLSQRIFGVHLRSLYITLYCRIGSTGQVKEVPKCIINETEVCESIVIKFVKALQIEWLPCVSYLALPVLFLLLVRIVWLCVMK